MEIQTTFLILLLVLARIGSFFVSMPVFSMRQIPALAKIGIVLVLSWMVMSWIPPIELQIKTLLELALLVIREAFLGLVLGWVTNMIFLAVQSAGDYLDFFAGLKMSSSFDPISGGSGTIYSNLFNWIGAVLFLALNGHHYLIKGIVNSCYFLPIGDSHWYQFKLEGIVDIITKFFVLSIQLALPICVILFLIDVILGLINRSVQQINVFILGMPLKLLVSFGVMLILTGGVIHSISWVLDAVVQILDEVMRFMLI